MVWRGGLGSLEIWKEKSVCLSECHAQAGLILPLSLQPSVVCILNEDAHDFEELLEDSEVLHHVGCPFF